EAVAHLHPAVRREAGVLAAVAGQVVEIVETGEALDELALPVIAHVLRARLGAHDPAAAAVHRVGVEVEPLVDAAVAVVVDAVAPPAGAGPAAGPAVAAPGDRPVGAEARVARPPRAAAVALELQVVRIDLAAHQDDERERRPPPPQRDQREEDERQRARAAAGVVVGADVAAAAAGGVDRDALRRVDALGERALLPRRAVDADARVDDALPRRRIAHRPRLGRALERRRAHVGHAQLLHLVAHVAGAAVAAARLHAGAVPALLVGVAGDV